MSRLQPCKKYVVLDAITGKIERGNSNAVKNLNEAEEFVEHMGWGDRLIIVELNCYSLCGLVNG